MHKETSIRLNRSLRNIRLTSLFKPEDIIPGIEATTQDEVIRIMLEKLALRYGIGNVDDAMAEVKDRIEKGGVGIAPGLVVPHARLSQAPRLRLAIATSKDGVMIGEDLAHVIILIVVPVDMPGAYMQTLQGIAKACDRPGAVEKLAAMTSAEGIWQHFDSGGNRLPDHLEARHIMAEVVVSLRESDSLARAIDLFLEHNASELPVLDEDDELVGVVTTTELVRVCMPEYLMWMDDMTPFLNFEPFAEVIRYESSTWLNDIMTDEYAQVSEDSPAILAMKEIGSKQTNYAYVLRDRKLVGVIRLHEFLRRVLR